MEKTNEMVVNYLAYLKQNKQVADPDELDVAINILQDVLRVEAAAPSPELLAFTDQQADEQEISSEECKNDGNAAMKGKDYQRARDCYTQAISNSMRRGEALEPRSVYFANRAMAMHGLGDMKGALADCQESVNLNPSYVKGLLRFAQYLEEDGQLPRAGEIYERLSEGDPANEQYREGLNRTRKSPPPAGQDPMGGLFGGLAGLQNDPEMQELMKNPKMAELAQQIQQNPMSAMGALSDPELAPMVKKLMGKISPQLAGMMGNMGGMFGGQ